MGTSVGQTLRIRSAEEADLPELVRIYDHYVTTTHITFDTRAFTVEERRPWWERFSDSGPHRILVALPNAGSIALHEKFGFTHVGTFREVGFKLGRYWDVSWYERDVS